MGNKNAMSTLNDNLPLLLLKARESSIAYLRPVLVRFGLTEQQWRVLRVLYRAGEISAQDLAGESCILSPSLSRILAKLESDELIIRKINNRDQRALLIRLSVKGKRLHNRVSPLVEKQFEELVESVGKETINDLVGLLEAFSDLDYRPRA